jgi:hypothetical protein
MFIFPFRTLTWEFLVRVTLEIFCIFFPINSLMSIHASKSISEPAHTCCIRRCRVIRVVSSVCQSLFAQSHKDDQRS